MMPTNKVFWVGLALFQIAFASAVFFITKNMYDDGATPSAHSVMDLSGARNAQDELRDAMNNPFFNNGSSAFDTISDPAEVSRLANEAFTNKDYGTAANLYRRLLSLDPQNVDVYNNLGLTLHYIGRTDEALEWLNKGVVVNGEYQRIWLTLGFVASAAGDTATARTALNNAVNKGSDESIRESAQRMLEQIP